MNGNHKAQETMLVLPQINRLRGLGLTKQKQASTISQDTIWCSKWNLRDLPLDRKTKGKKVLFTLIFYPMLNRGLGAVVVVLLHSFFIGTSFQHQPTESTVFPVGHYTCNLRICHQVANKSRLNDPQQKCNVDKTFTAGM